MGFSLMDDPRESNQPDREKPRELVIRCTAKTDVVPSPARG
jgi:hypothetical protein